MTLLRRRPHVLVARLDNLGDVLLAGPAVRAVAAGAGRVTLLAGRRGRAAAELLPGVDEVVVAEAPWIDPEPPPVDRARMLTLVDRLGELSIDEAVILTSFHQSALPLALLLRMAGVATVAAVSEDYPGSLLDVRHRISDDIHEVERALSLVGTLGYRLPPEDDGRLMVRRPAAATFRPPATEPYVVVHPGASVPARAWAPERHTALVEALVERGDTVVVTGAPSERSLTASVAAGGAARRASGSGAGRALDWGGRGDFAVLAEVLAHSRAVVVGNTGPAHLAAAVGAPVVSLFAPTVPAVRWRPWAVPHVLVGDQGIGCAGCRARMCPRPGHPCLSGVGVDEVLVALDVLEVRRGHPAAPRPAVFSEVGR